MARPVPPDDDDEPPELLPAEPDEDDTPEADELPGVPPLEAPLLLADALLLNEPATDELLPDPPLLLEDTAVLLEDTALLLEDAPFPLEVALLLAEAASPDDAPPA